jgi:hypothetical protein
MSDECVVVIKWSKLTTASANNRSWDNALHTCFSKSLKKTSPTCSFATSSLDMRAVWMVRLDLQFTAIHNATILKIHAWMLTLTDECRCQLRMLHEHANDQTYAQHIHVSKDHETWHCANVFLNAYRKTPPARSVRTSSLSRDQYEWHDWTCS